MYCEVCGNEIDGENEYGDLICEDCEMYCDKCHCYCFGESEDGMCEDCYEDYLEDISEEDDDEV